MGCAARATRTGDGDLIKIAARYAAATLCLRSALARRDLMVDIPAEIDIAHYRGTNPRTATALPIAWHHLEPETFAIGRALIRLDDVTTIGLHSAKRSIVDAYRLRHHEGSEMANEALRTWLRTGGQPAKLMKMSQDFRQATPALRNALEILL